MRLGGIAALALITAVPYAAALAACGVDAVNDTPVDGAAPPASTTASPTSSATGSSTADPESDAQTVDGTVDPPDTGADVYVDTGADTAPPNATLIYSNGFDTGSDPLCDGTDNAFRATLSRESAAARSGPKGCLVCLEGGFVGKNYTIDLGYVFGPPVAKGEVYILDVWVRTRSSVMQERQLNFRVRSSGGTAIQYEQTPDAIFGNNDWQELRLAVTVTASSGVFNMYVSSEHGAQDGDCFDIDDIAIYKAN